MKRCDVSLYWFTDALLLLMITSVLSEVHYYQLNIKHTFHPHISSYNYEFSVFFESNKSEKLHELHKTKHDAFHPRMSFVFHSNRSSLYPCDFKTAIYLKKTSTTKKTPFLYIKIIRHRRLLGRATHCCCGFDALEVTLTDWLAIPRQVVCSAQSQLFKATVSVFTTDSHVDCSRSDVDLRDLARWIATPMHPCTSAPQTATPWVLVLWTATLVCLCEQKVQIYVKICRE